MRIIFVIGSALVDHGAVAEAAVIGKMHEVKGQGISAFVTLKEGTEGSEALKEELKQHVSRKIGAHRAPRRYLLYLGVTQDPQRQDHAPAAPRHRRRTGAG